MISKVPVSTRVLYSSVAASHHPSAWLPCIACLKVRGSGNEAEFACSPSSSSSSDHITGGSASGSAEHLTFHHSPGGCKCMMCGEDVVEDPLHDQGEVHGQWLVMLVV